jgi:large subunit ribosomal protein L21
MYAVIISGGRQYRVSAGQKLKVEKLDVHVGSTLVVKQVLAVGSGESVRIGTPVVDGASVTATILAHGKGEKVHIFKMRRRKHYRKSQGHRQPYTELQITSIDA